MKAAEIKVGSMYKATVSGKNATLRIAREIPAGGWEAINLATGRIIRLRSARRLRSFVYTPGTVQV